MPFAVASIPVRLDQPTTVTAANTARSVSASLRLDQCWPGYDPLSGEHRVHCFLGDPSLKRPTSAFNVVSFPDEDWQEPDFGRFWFAYSSAILTHEFLLFHERDISPPTADDSGFVDLAWQRLSGASVRHLLSETGIDRDVFGAVILPDCAVSAYRDQHPDNGAQSPLIAAFNWLAFVAAPSVSSASVDSTILRVSRIATDCSVQGDLPSLIAINPGKFFVSRSEAILHDLLNTVSLDGSGNSVIVAKPDQALYSALVRRRYFMTAELAGDVTGTALNPEWAITLWEFQQRSDVAHASGFDLIPRAFSVSVGDTIARVGLGAFVDRPDLSALPVTSSVTLGDTGVDAVLFLDSVGHPIDPTTTDFLSRYGFSSSLGIWGAATTEAINLERGAIIAGVVGLDNPRSFSLSGIEGYSQESGGKPFGTDELPELSERAAPVTAITQSDDPVQADAAISAAAEVVEQSNPETVSAAEEQGDDPSVAAGQPISEAGDDTVPAIAQGVRDELMQLDSLLANMLEGDRSSIADRLDELLTEDGEVAPVDEIEIGFFTLDDNRNPVSLNEDGLTFLADLYAVTPDTTAEEVAARDLEQVWFEHDGAGTAAAHFARIWFADTEPTAQDQQGDDGGAGDADEHVTDSSSDGGTRIEQAPDQHNSENGEQPMPLPDAALQLSNVSKADTAGQGDALTQLAIGDIRGGIAGLAESDSTAAVVAVKAAISEADASKSLHRFFAGSFSGLTANAKDITIAQALHSRAFVFASAVVSGEQPSTLSDDDLDQRLADADPDTAQPETVGALLMAVEFLSEQPEDSRADDRAYSLGALQSWRWTSATQRHVFRAAEAHAKDTTALASLTSTLGSWWQELFSRIPPTNPDRPAVASLATQHLFRRFRAKFADTDDLTKIADEAKRSGKASSTAKSDLPPAWGDMRLADLLAALSEHSADTLPLSTPRAAASQENSDA